MSLKQTFEDAIYTYDQNEFMPVFEDGHLANKAEFALYKAEKAANVLGRLASRTFEATVAAGAVILEHVAMEVE